MKKSYRNPNMLQEKISGKSAPKNLFRALFSSRRYLTIALPYYDYLRGNVFIEDLKDAYGEEVPLMFDISVLLLLLYDDMMNQVKKGAKHKEIAAYLKQGAKQYFSKRTNEKRVMQAVNERLFTFETIEEEIEKDEKEKTAYLEIRIREAEILRGEVLLHDVEPFMEGIHVSIEQLISLVYLNFIQGVKAEGNSPQVQKSIVAHLKKI
ncbi:hypothetical protein [Heyndrickxia acidicola]|uniref:Uncharacterized protein n=1 Tax=Heyndrickxia acidicola TaxID=209389 RepID=A0ABU6MGK0_9BACI|nr:hypothetical protein [Heyndrickxia acidicola]MED1203538.1 hypothetical protein [Heyndrickxia acidicola]